MTNEQVEEKYNELIEETVKDLNQSLRRALFSGSIEVSQWENNSVLPKIIMYAACKRLVDQWCPPVDKYKKEGENIYLFI